MFTNHLKRWLPFFLSFALMMSSVLVPPPTTQFEAQATAPAIYNADGYGFSGVLNNPTEVTNPVWTGCKNWPAGVQHGFTGGVFDGTNIWMVPQGLPNFPAATLSDLYLVKMNTTTGKMTKYNGWPTGFSSSNPTFRGGIFDGTSVWLIPFQASHIVQVNITTGEMTGYDNWPSQAVWSSPYDAYTFSKYSASFSGGVFDGTNIWLIPHNTGGRLIKFNTVTGEMTSYGYSGLPGSNGNPSAFSGGVYDGTNIWLIPFNESALVKVNATTGAMTSYTSFPAGLNFTTMKFHGGLYDGTNIWLIPYQSPHLVKVNASNGDMSAPSSWPAGFTKGVYAFWGGVSDGTNLWMIPYTATHVVKTNMATGVMTAYNNWPTGFTKGNNAFSGGVYDGKDLWLIPAAADSIVTTATGINCKGPTGITLSVSSVAENSPIGTTVATLTATNADTATFSLVSGTGDTDNSSFVIEGNTLKTAKILNYEAQSNYTVLINVADSSGSTYEASFIISAEDKVEPPPAAPTDMSLSEDVVAEQRPIGTVVGLLSTTDVNLGDTFTYTLVDTEEESDTDNESFTIDGAALKTAERFDVDEKTSYKVLVRVEDSDGFTFDKEFTITVDEANVKLSRNNKRITLTFKENIYNTSSATMASAKASDLRGNVKLSINADAEEPTFSSLKSTDAVSTSKRRLIINLTDALNTIYNQVNVSPGALKDLAGNITTTDSLSDTFTADLDGPVILRTKVGGKNKVIRVRFDEPVFSEVTSLKNAVQLSSDGTNFSALPSAASVAVKGFTMTITLPQALTGNTNKVMIAANTLRDTARNKSAELKSNALKLDESAPVLKSARVSELNKTITLTFNETIDYATAGSTTARKVALRNALRLAIDGTNYTQLPTNAKAEVLKRTVKITLPTALTGTTNKLKLLANSVTDLYVSSNQEIETSALVLDKDAPMIQSSAISVNNKIVTLTFTEPVANAATGTTAAKATALRGKVKFASDGSAFGALPSSAAIKLSGNKMTITFAEELQGANNTIQIGEDAIQDALGNLNDELTSEKIIADDAKPAIKSVILSADNKLLTVTFSEVVANATPGKAAAKATALKEALQMSSNGTTFTAISGSPTIILKDNTLTVKLTAELAGSTNKLQIAADILTDAAGNTNSQLTTGNIIADEVPPDLRS